MTPEARERRRIRTPVLALTAAVWAATLLADPLGSAAGGSAAPAADQPVLAHSAHHHAVVNAGSSTTDAATASLAALIVAWVLMLTAMMALLLIPALRHAHARSLRRRRWRTVSLVTVAGLAVWTVGGVALLAVAWVLRSMTGQASLALLIGLVAAVAWQVSPLKQYCLNRHCTHPPIASFGRAADRDALRFGGTHAAWCLGSCWALMLVSFLAPAWEVAVMLAVSAWMWLEPLDRAQRPSWRIRLPLRSLRIARLTVQSLSQRPTAAQT